MNKNFMISFYTRNFGSTHLLNLIAVLMFLFTLTSCSSKNEKLNIINENCVSLDIPEFFSVENDYQMIWLGNIKNFEVSPNCYRLNDWLNQELFRYDRKDDFLDSLYLLDFATDNNSEVYKNHEYLRLFKYNFAFGNGNVSMTDCINFGAYWKIINTEIKFDRDCSFSLVSFQGKKEFSSKCFSLIGKEEKKVSSDEFEVVREAMYKTDFLNIAYFDTGEISLCDGYDFQIIYDGKSQVINSYREFYRSCPGELSPIGIVSDIILKLAK